MTKISKQLFEDIQILRGHAKVIHTENYESGDKYYSPILKQWLPIDQYYIGKPAINYCFTIRKHDKYATHIRKLIQIATDVNHR